MSPEPSGDTSLGCARQGCAIGCPLAARPRSSGHSGRLPWPLARGISRKCPLRLGLAPRANPNSVCPLERTGHGTGRALLQLCHSRVSLLLSPATSGLSPRGPEEPGVVAAPSRGSESPLMSPAPPRQVTQPEVAPWPLTLHTPGPGCTSGGCSPNAIPTAGHCPQKCHHDRKQFPFFVSPSPTPGDTPPLLSPRAGWHSGTHLAGLPHAPFRDHPPENHRPARAHPALPPPKKKNPKSPQIWGWGGGKRSPPPSAPCGAASAPQTKRGILPGRWVLI